jgi:hypothetical protein
VGPAKLAGLEPDSHRRFLLQVLPVLLISQELTGSCAENVGSCYGKEVVSPWSARSKCEPLLVRQEVARWSALVPPHSLALLKSSAMLLYMVPTGANSEI